MTPGLALVGLSDLACVEFLWAGGLAEKSGGVRLCWLRVLERELALAAAQSRTAAFQVPARGQPPSGRGSEEMASLLGAEGGIVVRRS